ncbi:hypothetical protein PGT21_015565 [Puccinia graminis f. sp. tritici]|uniref:Uncharacterized protein n=1 Tax=Puccinia graminis f. sp. tritici TaxID=56615 RepID=A0A5B0PEE3_PUCGR|nr:hypothetical protein PGT21_015565 [Puccinia graminis f. sp. tritici]
MLRNPLSINPEMTKIIAENTAKSEKACSKLIVSVDKLNNDLSTTADHIISTIREDEVIENAKKKDELDTIKDLLCQQNIRTEGIKNLINEQISLLRTDMKKEIQTSIHSLLAQHIPYNSAPGGASDQSKSKVPLQTVSHEHLHFNNPYMEEIPRDVAPHLNRSQVNTAPQQNRGPPPHLSNYTVPSAPQQSHHASNRVPSK